MVHVPSHTMWCPEQPPKSVEGTSTMDASDAVLQGVLHARGFSELDIEHTLTVKLPRGTSTLRPSHCWSRYTAWSYGQAERRIDAKVFESSRERRCRFPNVLACPKKKRRPLNSLSETSPPTQALPGTPQPKAVASDSAALAVATSHTCADRRPESGDKRVETRPSQSASSRAISFT